MTASSTCRSFFRVSTRKTIGVGAGPIFDAYFEAVNYVRADRVFETMRTILQSPHTPRPVDLFRFSVGISDVSTFVRFARSRLTEEEDVSQFRFQVGFPSPLSRLVSIRELDSSRYIAGMLGQSFISGIGYN